MNFAGINCCGLLFSKNFAGETIAKRGGGAKPRKFIPLKYPFRLYTTRREL